MQNIAQSERDVFKTNKTITKKEQHISTIKILTRKVGVTSQALYIR